MQATLTQLCDILKQHGIDAAPAGDAERLIEGVATLEDAQPGHISFLSNPKYERALLDTKASAAQSLTFHSSELSNTVSPGTVSRAAVPR